MGYLTNRTINYLNLHGALLAVVEQSFGIFAPIYLFSKGFSLPAIFILLAILNATRIPLRLLSFPIVHHLGLRAALMIGTSGFCFTFPILAQVQGYDIWLLIYIAMFGLFSALYWHCYHTFYSLAGEPEHRGKQLSVALGLSTGLTALAPLLSALFITETGFSKFFLLPLPVLAIMLFVLSRCENIKAPTASWKEGKKLMFNLGAKIHIAEASAHFPLNIAWLFAVYFYLGKMVTLGGILSLGILMQVIYQLWIGKAIDRQRGHFVANAAGSLRLLQVLVKAFLPLSFSRIIGAEALTGAANTHHALSQPTAMYNTGKSSGDTFWYWFFAETAYDLGTILGAGGVAILLISGVPIQLTILLAIPGILAVWYLTYRYFGNIRLNQS